MPRLLAHGWQLVDVLALGGHRDKESGQVKVAVRKQLSLAAMAGDHVGLHHAKHASGQTMDQSRGVARDATEGLTSTTIRLTPCLPMLAMTIRMASVIMPGGLPTE